jgi:cohesin loading factor subunit SCC2
MLEKDPTLLQSMPQVMRVIIKCASDKSILVRDSSLALIGKCIVLQPALERSVLESILTFTNDEAPGIRKRAMKLLKDIYLRNRDEKLRTDIAENLLQRMGDVDESVSELARQIFEDIWLTPFWTISKDEEKSVRARIALKEQVGLIIRTVQRDERTGAVLEFLLSQTLNSKSKDPSPNIRACKAMVAAMFAGIIDSTELSGSLEQREILRTLTIFAKAKPVLFTQQQLEHLQPYISNLSNADDLNLFRSVVIILRCVLPTLPAVQKEVLKKVQEDLLRSVAKLAKNELDEVVSCLWTINKELQNVEKLVNVELGVLQKLYKARLVDFSGKEQQQELSKVKRIILLAAHFAKYCDFQPQRQRFSSALAWWAGDTVADCVIDTIMPFSGKHQPLGLRSVAFESIGMVCQAWPKNFNRAEIARTFLQVLKNDDSELQKIVLSSFRDFFAIQDYQVEARTSSTEHDPLANGKLGGSMIASDNDGAAALIAQGFLKDILRIALSSQDEYALTATEVVASITRQGLVHPKECGPALVALETSTNPKIADIAFQQHSRLHQQHESMFEREYMRAIQEAFHYQRDIVHDVRGFTINPYKSKLHSMYEIIKTSKSKYQAKFLASYCSRVDFDLSKLDVTADPPTHLVYARFLIDNLAFFDYGRVEDVVHVTSCMEKIVAGTGAGIAHAINTEVFQVRLEPAQEGMNGLTEEETITVAEPTTVTPIVAQQEISPDRLRQLTTGSMILSMLWEARTFIRRLYGIQANHARHENKAKNPKDLTKAPTKNNAITGDKLVEPLYQISQALNNHDLSLNQCRKFAELLAIDNEVKVAAEADDENNDSHFRDSSLEGDSVIMRNGGVKRRGSASASNTPQKKRARQIMSERKKKTGKMHMNENSDSDF